MAFTTRSVTGPLAGWNGTAVGRVWAISGRGVGVGAAGVKISQAPSSDAADPRPSRCRSWRRSTRKVVRHARPRTQSGGEESTPPAAGCCVRLCIQLVPYSVVGLTGGAPVRRPHPVGLSLADSDEGVDVDLIGRGRSCRGIVRARDSDLDRVLDARRQAGRLPDDLSRLGNAARGTRGVAS